MATLAAATSLSLPPAPPAQLLDIQSLPSLEKFDSQLLDLIKATNEAGAAGINVMDELQAPDDDLALQRLMSLTRAKSHDAFNAFAQQQMDAAAVADQNRRAGAGQHLRGQLQHHQLPGMPQANGAPDLAAIAEYMKATQQQQGATPTQADYMNMLAAQGQLPPMQDLNGMSGLQGSSSLADALAGLHSQGGLNSFMEQLRAEGAMGANMANGFGGNLSAALSNLGLPPVDGPSSAVAQRKRANRGGRLTDIIKIEQSMDDGEGFQNEASIQAAAAAMAAALQGGGSDSRDSTQSPHASKRRKGANGQSAAAAAAAAAAALGSADSDYEVELHSTSHLHITADMDEETKTRLRREKNRIAARKCRAKKNALMTDLQATLAGLMRKNEEYKLQMVTWHKMFSREVRLREAMKRIIAVMWTQDVPPAATGYTANDIIIGIESGTLDINSVLRSFAAVSAASNGAATTPTAAQAAVAGGLASPAPLIINRSTSNANTPRSPGAAAAAAAAAEAAMAAAVGADGTSPVQGLVPQHLLMSHSSHISQGMPHTPHTPHTNEQAASMVLNAAGASGMMGAPNGGMSMNGAVGDPSNALGSPIPSVAAAALVDLAGTGAGQAGQGYGALEAGWGWGMEGGMAAQAGPSCITTGME